MASEDAARYPKRVRKLVLYGAYAQGRVARGDSSEAIRVHELQSELARVGWGQNESSFRQVYTSPFMPGASKQLWNEFNELQRRSTSPENAARLLKVTAYIDVSNAACRVEAPTLVLHVRDDHRPPLEQGRLLASTIPGARFVALEGNNHILLEDEAA